MIYNRISSGRQCNAGLPGTQKIIMLNLLVWGIGIWS